MSDFQEQLPHHTDAEVAEARDYWQRRANAGSAYGYGQRYADMCRAELKARAAATTGTVSSAFMLARADVQALGQPVVDNTVARLTREVLDAGADKRSLTVSVEDSMLVDGHLVRVTGRVRA